MIDRARPADVVLELVLELGAKLGIDTGAVVVVAQVVQGPDQRLRDEHAAVGAEMAARVRRS